jgi:hypothetical protein
MCDQVLGLAAAQQYVFGVYASTTSIRIRTLAAPWLDDARGEEGSPKEPPGAPPLALELTRRLRPAARTCSFLLNVGDANHATARPFDRRYLFFGWLDTRPSLEMYIH